MADPSSNPYTAPAAGPTVIGPVTGGYQPLWGMARGLVFFSAFRGLTILAFCGDWILFGVGTGTLSDRVPEVMNVISQATVPLGLLHYGALAFCLKRACENTRAMTTAPLLFTPAAMIYWFFVPFLNLYMPYRAVSWVWLTSAPDDTPEAASRPAQLWWLLWLLSGPVANVLAVFSPEGLFSNLWANALALASVTADALLIWALAGRQESRAARWYAAPSSVEPLALPRAASTPSETG